MPGKFLNAVLQKDGDKVDDHVRNEEVLQRIKEDRDILHRIKRRKANWICHIRFLKHVIQGKVKGRIQATGRRGRQMWLLEDLKENIGYRKLKEELLYRNLW